MRDIQPSDPAGVRNIVSLLMTADGSAYAYSYARNRSSLYLVEGLR